MDRSSWFSIYFLLFLEVGNTFAPANRKIAANPNNRKYIQKYPDFPVPAYYAHPIVLKRMQDIMKEGRAETIPEALKLLKEDLKALNSNVVVEKEEYDEIVTIKPMFLVMGYK